MADYCEYGNEPEACDFQKVLGNSAVLELVASQEGRGLMDFVSRHLRGLINTNFAGRLRPLGRYSSLAD
jgi:hypothetical protein